MARHTDVQTSFTSGEISPRAYTRIDAEFYGAACQLIDNFVVSPQGGALFRQGTKHVGEPISAPLSEPARLVPIRRGGTDDDLTLTIERATDLTPYSMLWEFDGRKDGSAYGTYPNHNYDQAGERKDLQYAQRHKQLVTVNGLRPPQFWAFKDNWDLGETRDMANVELPLRIFNDDKSPPPTAAAYTVDFTGKSAGFIYRVLQPSDTTEAEFALASRTGEYFGTGSEAATADSLKVAVTSCVYNAIFTPPTEQQLATVSVTHSAGTVFNISIDAPANKTVIDRLINNADFTDTIPIVVGGEPQIQGEVAWSYPTTVVESGNYYTCKVPHIAADPANKPPNTTFWNSIGVSAPAWESFQPTPTWKEGVAYGIGDRGFPETVCFHDQRLFFGATKDAPTTFWGSAVQDFENFTLGPEDDDALTFDLESVDTPAIRWMTSQRGLAIGTTNGDWLVSADITITPTNVQASRFTGRKSLKEHPYVVGNEIFYIDQSSSKLRRAFYERASQGYRNEDVTLTAEHLGRKGLFRLAAASVPETVMYIATQARQLLAYAYERLSGVAAFSRITLPDAEVYDLVSVFGRERGQDLSRGTDVIMMLIFRNGDWRMEFLPYPSLADEEPEVYAVTTHLDGWSEYDFAGSTSGTIDTIYAGQTVSVMAKLTGGDGLAYLGEITAAGTTLTLPYAADTVQIGYKYAGTIRTVEITSGPGGIAMGKKRRWNKLFMRLYASLIPQLNGWQEGAKYDQMPMDGPPQLFSGDVQTNDSGYDNGEVTIEHDLPFPCQVTGVFGQVGTHDA